MKAIVYHEYGSPDVLQLAELEKPVPADNEILVRVRAASVNPLDWHFMRGEPYLVRMGGGYRRPRNTRLGADLAGQVEAVGKDVTRFKPGDEVFGSRSGAFGEYVCTQGKGLAPKPANLTFEQAAAVPVAAITALQGLRDKGQVRAGQQVLVNGAAGGVGTFAVQIARAYGAEVTAVCSTRNLDLLRSIGAEQVIDYTREDYTRGERRYDLIFDAVGNHSALDSRRALTPHGTLVLAGGSGKGKWLGPMLGLAQAALVSPFVGQKLVSFLAQTTMEDLVVLQQLLEAAKITPVIDRSYPLSEVPEAIRYLEAGHARGKVVITIP